MSKIPHYSEGIVTKQNLFEKLNAVNPETNELKNPPKPLIKKSKPKKKKKPKSKAVKSESEVEANNNVATEELDVEEDSSPAVILAEDASPTDVDEDLQLTTTSVSPANELESGGNLAIENDQSNLNTETTNDIGTNLEDAPSTFVAQPSPTSVPNNVVQDEQQCPSPPVSPPSSSPNQKPAAVSSSEPQRFDSAYPTIVIVNSQYRRGRGGRGAGSRGAPRGGRESDHRDVAETGTSGGATAYSHRGRGSFEHRAGGRDRFNNHNSASVGHSVKDSAPRSTYSSSRPSAVSMESNKSHANSNLSNNGPKQASSNDKHKNEKQPQVTSNISSNNNKNNDKRSKPPSKQTGPSLSKQNTDKSQPTSSDQLSQPKPTTGSGGGGGVTANSSSPKQQLGSESKKSNVKNSSRNDSKNMKTNSGHQFSSATGDRSKLVNDKQQLVNGKSQVGANDLESKSVTPLASLSTTVSNQETNRSNQNNESEIDKSKQIASNNNISAKDEANGKTSARSERNKRRSKPNRKDFRDLNDEPMQGVKSNNDYAPRNNEPNSRNNDENKPRNYENHARNNDKSGRFKENNDNSMRNKENIARNSENSVRNNENKGRNNENRTRNSENHARTNEKSGRLKESNDRSNKESNERSNNLMSNAESNRGDKHEVKFDDRNGNGSGGPAPPPRRSKYDRGGSDYRARSSQSGSRDEYYRGGGYRRDSYQDRGYSAQREREYQQGPRRYYDGYSDSYRRQYQDNNRRNLRPNSARYSRNEEAPPPPPSVSSSSEHTSAPRNNEPPSFSSSRTYDQSSRRRNGSGPPTSRYADQNRRHPHHSDTASTMPVAQKNGHASSDEEFLRSRNDKAGEMFRRNMKNGFRDNSDEHTGPPSSVKTSADTSHSTGVMNGGVAAADTRDALGNMKKWSDECWQDDPVEKKVSSYQEQTNKVKVSHEIIERVSAPPSSNEYFQELEGDLLAAPKQYSLALAVSEDFRMPMGLAAQFRQEFKRLDTLLDQNGKMGEVAFLQDKDRFVYYLISKKLANSRSSLKTLRQCLARLRMLCTKHGVTHLAMPQLGQGPDRLDWNDIRQILITEFENSQIHVLVYRKSEDYEPESKHKGKSSSAKLFVEQKPVTEIEEYTSIIVLGTLDGHVSESMKNLNAKFEFVNEYQAQVSSASVGSIITLKRSNYFISIFLINERKSERVCFEHLSKCMSLFKKHLLKNDMSYVAFEVMNERHFVNDMINEKLISYLKNSLPYNVELYICWPSYVEDRHFLVRAKQYGGGGNYHSNHSSSGNNNKFMSNSSNNRSENQFSSSNNNAQNRIQIDSSTHFPKL